VLKKQALAQSRIKWACMGKSFPQFSTTRKNAVDNERKNLQARFHQYFKDARL
jgi:hypothetical protein